MARRELPMARGGGQDLPPRENTPLGEGLPTRRTSERICAARERSPRRKPPDTAHERKDLPTREHAPRRRPPDTAHERKDLPRAGTRPTAKASRHGARAKGFAPRENAPLGEGLPTRRTGERICPAQKRSPRRRPPDTAHQRKDLPRAGTRPSAKAARHGARAKEFAPRRNALLGEGLPTRHTGERICPARERSPRRRPPDTAHERKELPRAGTLPRRRPPDTAHGRKDLPRAETLPTAKASRHGARAKGFAPRGVAFAPHADERRAAPDRRTAGKTPLRRGRTRDRARAKEFAPRGSRSLRGATNGGPLPDRRTAGKTPLRRGRTRDGAAAAEFIHRKK